MARAAAKSPTGKAPAKVASAKAAPATAPVAKAPSATGARGYWIARLDVIDAGQYDAYRALNAKAFAKFGGRFIVRGGDYARKKGSSRQHNVIIEFPTLAAAQACYDSKEYQAALAHLALVGPVDLLIIGGYDGPQPGEAAR